jgi:hypothetical protein
MTSRFALRAEGQTLGRTYELQALNDALIQLDELVFAQLRQVDNHTACAVYERLCAVPVTFYVVFLDRCRRLVELPAWTLPQWARNCVMNVCSSRASTASGARASATANAV